MICSPFKKKNFGFTLIELLIVIAIIAVLTTFGAASYTRIQQGARDAQRKADLKKVAGALEQFYSDNNHYPNATNYANLLVFLKQTPPLITYLNSLPTDPRSTTTTYQYVYATGTAQQSYCLADNLETEDHTGTDFLCNGTNYDYVVKPTD